MTSTIPKQGAAGSTPSPYQIDPDQALKASSALLQHVRQEAKRLKALSEKKDLLEDDYGASETEDHPADDSPIWLNLTTKKHIADKNRLKPGKISVPHSINTSPALSICLITADPQRAIKEAVADAAFPRALSSKIGRIIGFSKLKAKYRQFENRRQLWSEHDIFLADDRIITRLVETLGKIFYKDTAKRPIPIRIAQLYKVERKKVKQPVASNNIIPSKDDKKPATFASAAVIAREIETALKSVSISLRPGTSAAVRVGRASFTPRQLSENINTVASVMIDRYVAQGWRNVKAIHVKSPNSAALPIWLADEMWTGETDVIRDGEDVELRKKQEADLAERRETRTKRKRERQQQKQQQDRAAQDEGMEQSQEKKQKKTTATEAEEIRKTKVLEAARKVQLAQQKARALQVSAN